MDAQITTTEDHDRCEHTQEDERQSERNNEEIEESEDEQDDDGYYDDQCDVPTANTTGVFR